MRLDKYLSDAGIGSRSEVKKIISKGYVTINDLIVKDSKINIFETDVIKVLGNIVTYETLVYYMLNKPKGVVSASKDEVDQTTRQLITDYQKNDLFNVGRLDKDTEGIILLTNDGLLSHQLLSPKYHVEKTYLVDFRGDFLETYITYFETGLTLSDGTVCKPAKIALINDHQALLTIHEGKYHQVKRMFGSLNMGVTGLKRVSFGPLKLDSNLASGDYRKLTPLEIQQLRDFI
jgi:16S rRNA pseudouridine516 synthase